jgi:hypothetical protein
MRSVSTVAVNHMVQDPAKRTSLDRAPTPESEPQSSSPARRRRRCSNLDARSFSPTRYDVNADLMSTHFAEVELTHVGRTNPGGARETVCKVNRQRTMIRGGFEQTSESDVVAWRLGQRVVYACRR